MFFDRELRRKAQIELSVEKMTGGRNAIEVVFQKRFNFLFYASSSRIL